jgi:hypothetical protein
MYHQFNRSEAEDILRSSEGGATSHRGGRAGHAGSRHLLLSNSELLERYTQFSQQMVWRNGRRRGREYTLITAFCALPDMIDAAVLVLNAPQTQRALADFFTNTPRGPGMRAEIAFTSAASFRMRFAQGEETVRTMPVSDLVMILDRVDQRSFGLHVQTFFGTLEETPRNTATIYTAEGAATHSHFAPS